VRRDCRNVKPSLAQGLNRRRPLCDNATCVTSMSKEPTRKLSPCANPAFTLIANLTVRLSRRPACLRLRSLAASGQASRPDRPSPVVWPRASPTCRTLEFHAWPPKSSPRRGGQHTGSIPEAPTPRGLPVSTRWPPNGPGSISALLLCQPSFLCCSRLNFSARRYLPRLALRRVRLMHSTGWSRT
jgi:hypothetical protein